MEIQKIIDQLTYPGETLPEEALQATIDKKEEITPLLLELLADAILNIDKIVEDELSMGHIYAMLLLAQFREPRAYPLIVRFFSLPGKLAEEATGDMGFEYLHRILASVCHGDTTLIKEMIENESINEYFRCSALQALSCLVATEQATRESVLEYMVELLRSQKPESIKEFSTFYSNIVSEMTDLYPEEFYTDIADAFDRGLVDLTFIDKEFVDSYLAQGKDKVLSLLKNDTNTYVDDVIKEMRRWYKPAGSWSPESDKAPEPDEALEKMWALHEGSKPKPASGTNKIGRNEPCPCGSGKKYKKCCGA